MGHIPLAYRLARWLLGNDADAEDAVQDATLKALKRLDDLRDDDCRAWYLAIVRNESLNAARRNSRIVEMDIEETADTAGNVEVHEEVYARLTAERLWALIDSLPLPFRELIVLREAEGLSYAEIAQVLRVPVGTVMSRLSRAREALQAKIAGEAGL
ncbi:MAG TPA: sigma-70 family RNA polymerase sigma factor [Fimbriimonadaceae bacterium]|nr:sigma-70 family RNA polymerase sigma factor [Fimbriimonadaceae bacterium]